MGDFVKVAEIRRDGENWRCRNTQNSLLIPVFCCMAFAVEYWYTARNKNVPLGTFFIVLAQAWVELEPTVAGSNHRKKADGNILACSWQKNQPPLEFTPSFPPTTKH